MYWVINMVYGELALKSIKNFKSVLGTVVLLGAILAFWEVLVVVLRVPRYILPPVSAIAESTARYSNYLLANLADTLLHALTGLILAAVFSFAISVLLAYSDTLREAVNPLIAGFNAIPRAALVPLLVIWFGLGGLPRILTALLIAFYPVLVPTLTAMVTIERELQELLLSFGATKRQILVKVAIPRSMPYFLSSLHAGLASAVVGTVIAEMIASDKGMGYVILSSTSRLDTSLAFSCLLLLMTSTLVLSKILGLLERRLVKWAYVQSTV